MNNQLIKIEEKDGKQTVNARELHEFLEVQTRFADWIKRRISEYGFEDNVDFITILNYENSPPAKEYHISLDMAKELSMVERNEKGKQARQYFIAMEKKANNLPALSEIEIVAMVAQKMVDQQKQLQQFNNRLDLLEAKTTSSTNNYFSVAGYCSLNHVQVTVKQAAELGRLCAKLSRELGYEIDSMPDPRYGRVNTYHTDILRQVVC